jgi:hypothetical protein
MQRVVPVAAVARRAEFNAQFLRCGTSAIDGTGLFATRAIHADDVITEYVGELVDNEEADAREAMYRSKRLADYMFRIDSSYVIDATVRGSAARYVNHCCEPNCYAVVTLPADFDESQGTTVGIAGFAPAEAGKTVRVDHWDSSQAQARPALARALQAQQQVHSQKLAESAAGRYAPFSPDAASGSSSVDHHAHAGGVSESVSPESRDKTRRRRVFIYARRAIAAGEELTYDYQFSREKVAVPCKCGALSCRGTLNL